MNVYVCLGDFERRTTDFFFFFYLDTFPLSDGPTGRNFDFAMKMAINLIEAVLRSKLTIL